VVKPPIVSDLKIVSTAVTPAITKTVSMVLEIVMALVGSTVPHHPGLVLFVEYHHPWA